MSHHCAAALLDSKMQVLDDLKSGWSPGKRSGSSQVTAPLSLLQMLLPSRSALRFDADSQPLVLLPAATPAAADPMLHVRNTRSQYAIGQSAHNLKTPRYSINCMFLCLGSECMWVLILHC